VASSRTPASGIDLGARAGAEIHFGFMDIPQLSLQGSVGARFEFVNVESTATVGGVESVATGSFNQFRTTYEDNPWNILIANVAALYYF
jgi:hypothetical protein